VRRVLFSLWLILAAAPMAVAPVADGKWTYAADDRFEVYTTGGDKTARRALEEFGRVHAFYSAFFSGTPAFPGRTTLLIFSSQKDFARYAANASVKAFYQSSVDRDFIVMPTLDAGTLPAVIHEYAHLMARRTGRVYPLWLGEGLADFFSTMRPQGAQMLVGTAPLERERALGFGVRLTPLDRLLEVDRNSPEYNTPNLVLRYYADSWVLTHMLMSDQAYRPRFNAFLDKMTAGEDAGVALTAVYERTIDEIERDYKQFALRKRFRTWLMDFAEPPPAAPAAPRPATDFEADVVTASLLAANESRAAEAQAAFDALEKINPNDVALADAIALFAVRRGSLLGARARLAKAVALGSANGRIYSNYATSLGADATAEAEEDALFAKAASLRPADTEVRTQQARSLLRRRRGADALAAIEAVKAVQVEYASVLDDLLTEATLRARERVIDGTLTRVICDGAARTIEVTTPAGPRRFVTDEQPALRPGGPLVTFGCGPHNRAVRVGYRDDGDPINRIDGRILFLEVR
jgi:hypothetical protein